MKDFSHLFEMTKKALRQAARRRKRFIAFVRDDNTPERQNFN